MIWRRLVEVGDAARCRPPHRRRRPPRKPLIQSRTPVGARGADLARHAVSSSRIPDRAFCTWGTQVPELASTGNAWLDGVSAVAADQFVIGLHCAEGMSWSENVDTLDADTFRTVRPDIPSR